MPLKAYEEWAPEPLEFPIKGKTYTVAPLAWDSGVKLSAIMRGEDDAPSDPDTQNRLLMGDTWDQMKADGVPLDALNRAALTCLVDFRIGREAAEMVWESGLTPEALAPKQGAASTSTAAESTTPTAASTSGTTSPKGSTKKRAKASRSTTSSTTGT